MAGFVHPELLVETDWLEQHLADPKVVVLDCTTHLVPNPKITYDVVPGRDDFEKSHIKGAQFCDVRGTFRIPLKHCVSCGKRPRILLPPCGGSGSATARKS